MRKKPSTTGKGEGITLKIILDHMQNMQRVLREEIKASAKELKADILQRIDRVESKLSNLDRRYDWMNVGMDKRLDDIEIKELPAIKKFVGMR